MHKSFKFLAIPAAVLLLLCLLFLKTNDLSNWDFPEGLSADHQHRIRQEILQAAQVLDGEISADIDAEETLLIDAGFSAFDTDAVYPTYLTNPEALTDFWDSVCAGKDASDRGLPPSMDRFALDE